MVRCSIFVCLCYFVDSDADIVTVSSGQFVITLHVLNVPFVLNKLKKIVICSILVCLSPGTCLQNLFISEIFGSIIHILFHFNVVLEATRF